MKIKFKKIRIEHLGYTIYVKDVAKHPRNKWEMYVENIDNNSCILYSKKNIPPHEFPTLAHEVLHVLQNIAGARNIDMTYEEENMGYLMQYILNAILGYKYV